jgi:transcriptional regulator with XRE-family HTH domain
MDENGAKRFGDYIRRHRKQQKLTSRGLAERADIDIATVVRLEQGKYRTPRPKTLEGLSSALELPLADVFAMADYVLPYDLPTMTPYLKARYGFLPEEAISSLDAYFRTLLDKYGLDLNGPAAREDEITKHSES